MAGHDAESQNVNARILYWGIEGAGKTANLRAIHAKLRADHRGELRQRPTRLDPTVHYEVLPIELGEVRGVRTRIQVTTAPSAPEQAPTRKQLLDEVDGLVLVLDAQASRLDENLRSFEELRSALAAYGRSLAEIPLVVQYNKRDLADPYVIEELHRKLDLPKAPVFEAVATEAVGVLQTLTTVSKMVIRNLRESGARAPAPATEPAAPAPAAPEAQAGGRPSDPSGGSWVESAILEEERDASAAKVADRTQVNLDQPWSSVAEGEPEEEAPAAPAEPLRAAAPGSAGTLRIAVVGAARREGERGLRVPLVLEDESGHRFRVSLAIQLDPPPDDEGA